MAAVPQHVMSRAEYLAFERASKERHEFIAGEVYALAGGTENHDLIFGNTFTALRAQLRGRGCTVYSSNMRVARDPFDVYMYPDISIVCGAPQFEDPVRDTLLNPTVLIEILSPSTEQYDRGRKFHRYQSLPSFREYLLIAQDEPVVDHYIRQADGHWLWSVVEGLAGTVTLPTINCALTLAAIYEQVALGGE
jgi:Uma2 family endonuclease